MEKSQAEAKKGKDSAVHSVVAQRVFLAVRRPFLFAVAAAAPENVAMMNVEGMEAAMVVAGLAEEVDPDGQYHYQTPQVELQVAGLLHVIVQKLVEFVEETALEVLHQVHDQAPLPGVAKEVVIMHYPDQLVLVVCGWVHCLAVGSANSQQHLSFHVYVVVYAVVVEPVGFD